jgi:PhnB protein
MEEAFTFYSRVFQAEITKLIRYSDLPGSDKMSDADRLKIFHISLDIGMNVLMGTDILESPNQQLNAGNNFSLHITVDDLANGQRIFEALSADGDVLMPLSREEWSALFGICRDKFGIQWMINVKS